MVILCDWTAFAAQLSCTNTRIILQFWLPPGPPWLTCPFLCYLQSQAKVLGWVPVCLKLWCHCPPHLEACPIQGILLSSVWDKALDTLILKKKKSFFCVDTPIEEIKEWRRQSYARETSQVSHKNKDPLPLTGLIINTQNPYPFISVASTVYWQVNYIVLGN